jgi:molybdopterin-guanine dinucleotide biosynthesis protein
MTKNSIDKESYNELEKKYDKLKKEIKAVKHDKSRLEVELAKESKDKFYYKTVGSNQVVCIQKMLDIMMNMPEARQVMANSMGERKGNPNDCKC